MIIQDEASEDFVLDNSGFQNKWIATLFADIGMSDSFVDDRAALITDYLNVTKLFNIQASLEKMTEDLTECRLRVHS